VRARAVVLAVGLAALCALVPATQAATIQSFPLPAGGPHAVAPSSDGSSVFVGARDCGYLGRFDIASSAFAPVIPQSGGGIPCAVDLAGSGRGVFSAVDGPDGMVYFTIYDTDEPGSAGAVGRVNPNGSGLEMKATGVHPLDITVGPDSNIWFTVNGPPAKVGRITPASFGLAEFSIPEAVQGPRGIVSGGDGKLYVLGGEADKIWRVTSSGVVTDIIPAPDGPSFGELGPDGRIWFTLFEGNGVSTFDPAASTFGATIPISGEPWDVAFGSDGIAYATRFNASSIAQLVPGRPGFTSLPLPTASGFPTFIARSPDGNLYAAAKNENALLRIAPDGAPPATAPNPPATPKDTDPPNTRFRKKPAKRSRDRTPTFKAASDEPGSRFRCRLDRGKFKPCGKKKTFQVRPGVHTVRFLAIDAAGNSDPTPAKFTFTVLR
jgi:streptogramin lyase